MKIVHIVNSIDPSQGGPPAVAMRLAAAQAGLGHQTNIVAFGRMEDLASEQYANIPYIERVSVDIVSAPRGPVERIAAWHARGKIHEAMRSAQFAHLHGLWSRLVVHGALTAKREGVPYAVRPAGVLDRWSLRQKALKKRIALSVLWRRIVENADFVHVLNEQERELARPAVPNARFRVFPNGVFWDEFERMPEPSTFRRTHLRSSQVPFILFLGRLHYKKGLDILAAAFAELSKKLPHVEMVVAGPDAGARAEFERMVARLGLAHRIHVIGPIWGTAKLAALSDAACFCLPSRQEGFSVAITEALAAGCPVVVSQNCHFPEVSKFGAGVETSLEPSSVATALERVLTDAQLATRMGDAGRLLVKREFTWPQIAERVVAQYSAVLAERGSARSHGVAARAEKDDPLLDTSRM